MNVGTSSSKNISFQVKFKNIKKSECALSHWSVAPNPVFNVGGKDNFLFIVIAELAKNVALNNKYTNEI